MRICFVLPRTLSRAVGGYKVVFDYANRLASRGENASILFLNTRYLKRYHAPRALKKLYFDVLTLREPRWFALDGRVRKVSDYSRRLQGVLEDTDVAVATAVGTARYVAERFRTGNKLYLIQGYETWDCPEEEVLSTYRLGMKNITVSGWLQEIVEESGASATLIPNPIDTDMYRVTRPIERRRRHSIAVLYNPNPIKGFDNAMSVMRMLRDRYPDFKAHVFGAYPKPEGFPEWISYTRNATQAQTVDIYNSAGVFLCPSLGEGYGLTGLESMACGCALASTDYAAVHEYAIDGVNCLLSPVGDVEAQFENVCRLFDNDGERARVATAAASSLQRFTWEAALESLYEVIGADEAVIMSK